MRQAQEPARPTSHPTHPTDTDSINGHYRTAADLLKNRIKSLDSGIKGPLSVGTAIALVAGSARDRFVRSPDRLATATGSRQGAHDPARGDPPGVALLRGAR